MITVSTFIIDFPTDENGAPSLLVSVVVNEQLNIKAFVYSTLLPFSQYAYLLPDDSWKRMSEILNILAFCKSCVDKSVEKFTNQLLDTALLLLDYCIEVVKSSRNDDLLYLPLLTFVTEQLKLMQVPKQRQRYSTATINTSFLRQLTSSALYKKLRDLFKLPSIRRLQTYRSDLTVISGAVDLTYLRQKTTNLSGQEKNCNPNY